jgi:hypothetical protein
MVQDPFPSMCIAILRDGECTGKGHWSLPHVGARAPGGHQGLGL